MHQKTIAQPQIDMIGVASLEDRQCHKKNLQTNQHKKQSAKRDSVKRKMGINRYDEHQTSQGSSPRLTKTPIDQKQQQNTMDL
jgi:hypothetical protein